MRPYGLLLEGIVRLIFSEVKLSEISNRRFVGDICRRKTNRNFHGRVAEYMDSQLKQFIEAAIGYGAYKLILSNPKSGEYKKITFSLLNDAYEIEKLTIKQAFHSRVAVNDAANEILSLMDNFKQLNAWSNTRELSARYTSKGKLLTHETKLASAPEKRLSHDREKDYRLKGRHSCAGARGRGRNER